MAHGEVVIRFEKVSFEYGHNKPILDAVDFSVRRHMKVTIMGQNGAGKSTLVSLITGERQPEEGAIHLAQRTTIALSRQVIPRDELDLTVREFFEKCFTNKVYDIDPRIDDVLEVVNLKGHEKVHERTIRSFSGGQQARVLLAYALIQNPDILLLDEPTNNLDKAGIDHLIEFLVMYDKTVIVISHDADFLNCFTEGVIYLDVFTKKVETYVGDYYSVVEEIQNRIDREIKKNAQLEKEIQDKVEVRREDKTIREFEIPAQGIIGDVVTIKSIKVIKNHEPVIKEVDIMLRQRDRLLIAGPNGVGKSTLLRTLVNGSNEGVTIMKNTRVGYYSQDFATLDYEQTVFDSLQSVVQEGTTIEKMRAVAAGFLLSGETMGLKISHLSEGQKGLLSFARLVLLQPGLLVLDEPTNHINFRHIPVIAEAINNYQGTVILISHMPDFVEKIKFDQELDLGRY